MRASGQPEDAKQEDDAHEAAIRQRKTRHNQFRNMIKSKAKLEEDAAETETVLITEEETVTGNFAHLKKKNKRFQYDSVLRSKDNYFNVQVGAQCDTYFRGQKVRFKERKSEHFASVVELDAYEYHKVVFHTFLNEILQSAIFKGVILALVLMNAVMIGAFTFPKVNKHPDVARAFSIIELCVLGVFIFEVILKWLYDFRLFWRSWWNILDFTLILITVGPSLIPIDFLSGDSSDFFITLRAVRAFRSLRSVSAMASLSIVVHTVVKSIRDMVNIILVLIVFMLVLALMGVFIFDLQDIPYEYFQEGASAWYLVFICVTQDGWAQILVRFNDYKGNDTHKAFLVTYLLIAISVGGFVFANLIVAVIVTNLELAVKEFRDEKALSENPLDFRSDHLSGTVEIINVYDLLTQDNTALIAQRPFKIPSLKKISRRRLQTYIGLIVALEHNMLEAELIMNDFQKIMAVLVSVMAQLDNIYNNKTTEKLEEEKQDALRDFNNLAMNTEGIIPADKIAQMEAYEKLQKYKLVRPGVRESIG